MNSSGKGLEQHRIATISEEAWLAGVTHVMILAGGLTHFLLPALVTCALDAGLALFGIRLAIVIVVTGITARTAIEGHAAVLPLGRPIGRMAGAHGTCGRDGRRPAGRDDVHAGHGGRSVAVRQDKTRHRRARVTPPGPGVV